MLVAFKSLCTQFNATDTLASATELSLKWHVGQFVLTAMTAFAC